MHLKTMLTGFVLGTATLLFVSCAKENPAAPQASHLLSVDEVIRAASPSLYYQLTHKPAASSTARATVDDAFILHGLPRMQGNNQETFECVQHHPNPICCIIVVDHQGSPIIAQDEFDAVGNNAVAYTEDVDSFNSAGAAGSTKSLIINDEKGPYLVDANVVSAHEEDDGTITVSHQ